MNRDQVIRQILNARTCDEIKTARESRLAFFIDHQDDLEIIDYGGFLMRLEDALQDIRAKQTVGSV